MNSDIKQARAEFAEALADLARAVFPDITANDRRAVRHSAQIVAGELPQATPVMTCLRMSEVLSQNADYCGWKLDNPQIVGFYWGMARDNIKTS